MAFNSTAYWAKLLHLEYIFYFFKKIKNLSFSTFMIQSKNQVGAKGNIYAWRGSSTTDRRQLCKRDSHGQMGSRSPEEVLWQRHYSFSVLSKTPLSEAQTEDLVTIKQLYSIRCDGSGLKSLLCHLAVWPGEDHFWAHQ